MPQQIDRPAFDRIWHAVETDSTNNALKVALEDGVQPPTNAPGWDIVMDYSPDGKQQLVWDRSVRVVIDPAGFRYNGPLPGPDAIQVDHEVYDRIWEAAQNMDDSTEIAAFVRSQGVEPPDESPDWEVYIDSVTGRGGDERPVWYRVETVPLEPVT